MSPHTEPASHRMPFARKARADLQRPTRTAPTGVSAVMVALRTSLSLTGLAGEEEGDGGDERERPEGRGVPAPWRLAPAQ